MSLKLRRYARTTGYARPWVYALFAAAFAALAIWGGVRGDWIVAALAAAMALTASIIAPIAARLARALAASNEEAAR
jgi:uncharacterized membrane protein YjjP (DUF1212 family)